MQRQRERKVWINILFSDAGESYLFQQAQEIKRRSRSRMGISGLVRGICEGFAKAGFDLSDSAETSEVADKVAAALQGKGN